MLNGAILLKLAVSCRSHLEIQTKVTNLLTNHNLAIHLKQHIRHVTICLRQVNQSAYENAIQYRAQKICSDQILVKNLNRFYEAGLELKRNFTSVF